MVRFGTTLAILATAVSSTTAFCPHSPAVHKTRFAATANEDTDFDAPVLNNPQTAGSVLDHDIVVVDDECYLGKYGQYEECVDFDPMHAKKEIDAKATSELPNFSKLGEEIMGAFKNSPLGKIFSN